MRVLFKKVVLLSPTVLYPDPVGQLRLVERFVIQLEFTAFRPWSWILKFEENAEFHTFTPK